MDEKAFQRWYADWAQKAGLDPNPDNPLHKYDYRAAFRAGAVPRIDPGDGLYHWPSKFKSDDHPNRFVGGVDTKKEDALTEEVLQRYGVAPPPGWPKGRPWPPASPKAATLANTLSRDIRNAVQWLVEPAKEGYRIGRALQAPKQPLAPRTIGAPPQGPQPLPVKFSDEIEELGKDFTPGLGELRSAKQGIKEAGRGNYGAAALAGLGAIPLIGKGKKVKDAEHIIAVANRAMQGQRERVFVHRIHQLAKNEMEAKDEAMKFGAANQQKAIFDRSKGEALPVETPRAAVGDSVAGRAIKEAITPPKTADDHIANLRAVGENEAADNLAKYMEGSKVRERLFHGTTRNFDEFNIRKGANPENDFGRGFYFTNNPKDAATNYAGEGPDLKWRIEQVAEELSSKEYIRRMNQGPDPSRVVFTPEENYAFRQRARKKLGIGPANMLPVFVNAQQPLNLDRAVLDEEELYRAIRGVSKKYGLTGKLGADSWQDVWSELMDAGATDAAAVNKKLLEGPFAYIEHPQTGALVGRDAVKDVFKRMGYDAVVRDADLAFGTRRQQDRKSVV